MPEVNERAESDKWLNTGLKIIATIMVLYHLINTQYFIFGGIEHRNVHLGFSLLLIFLNSMRGRNRNIKLFGLAAIILVLGSVLYVGYLYEDLEMRAMFNTKLDLAVGVILILVVLEGSRRGVGNVLPVFAIFLIAYFLLGRYFPGAFQTAAIPPKKIIPALSIALTGIYGVALSVSASYIFLFVVFGTLLQTSGATGFFMELGRLAGRRIRSGPAISSVITSALMGTTTGSIGANIVTTGSFTIPLMKKAGYRPEQAGAIESAASNGGQIMPPVMGAAAFAMAAVTGFSYLKIIIAAIIPAILYFMTVGLYALLQAAKLGLRTITEEVDVKEMLLRAPLFILPVGLIVYLLVLGRPLMYCAFWAIISAMVLSLLRKQTRPSIGQWIKGFTDGAITGAGIGAATACLGLILESMTGTGLGIKLPELVETWSGGNMLIA
ncbi:MAG: TRAP transporter fused permease subunit, partial [Deltaproteobacteria bacterium]|nr:TRAP transporter fused permease subunit [Deltaproteobacteria bacterium]